MSNQRLIINPSFKLLTPTAKLPKKAEPGSAGFDLFADEEVCLQPGEFRTISLGFAAELPFDMEGQIRPRSGMAAKFGITVLNAPGTIDSSFRATWKVLLINHSKSNYHVKVGDRIAQVVFAYVANPRIIQVTELSDTERGEGGFGSTGVR
jgi:dUTP pyrophosphatase